METLQPKLRFPEFDGNWKLKKLGDIGNFIGGGTPSTSNEDFWKGDIPWISSSDIFDNEIHDIRISRFLTKEAINESATKIIPKNSILLVSRVGVGKLAINKVEVCTSQDFTNIIVSDDNSYFIGYNLISKKNILSNFSQGTSIKGFTSNDIKTLGIKVPSQEEQTKIANFLSSVDEKLNLLKEKKELLEDYKKGIMQKIFNQEIRFKDDNGNDFGDWEESTIAEICSKIQSGGTPKSTNRDFYDGDIPFLSISDMTKQGKYIEFTSNHISDDGLKNSSSWLVPTNSIIYSMYASVGFVAINKIPLATSQAVLNLILKENINIEYVYYFLMDFQKYLAEFITTGTQGNLNAQTVKGFNIPLPCKEEQTKIANFLSAIDEKIELISNQIQDTQEYKKGLLQQMFV